MNQLLKDRIAQTKTTLLAHNQAHLLAFINTLTETEITALLDQIEGFDFTLIDNLIAQYIKSDATFEMPSAIDPAPAFPLDPDSQYQGQYDAATRVGEQMIRKNQVAAFTVAGGAGTRLNYPGPKGNVPATPIQEKTLFQLFAEGIDAIQQQYQCTIVWYIMTSESNHDETIASFEKENYFGLKKENVICFPQGMMPCFAADGKILLDQKGVVSVSPDGHGGSLRALYTSGAVQDMKARGIEVLSYFQIDNPIVMPIDPRFIGLHANAKAGMSSKAVIKVDPLEKVGNFTVVDDKITVIEYSDLPDEVAKEKDKDGNYQFMLGSIAIHLISRTFIEEINKGQFSLPWHKAIKSVPFIDTTGKRVTPERPNAVKLESFVFDALPMSDTSIILSIDRNEEFAPIKNATGVDSRESSKQLQINRAAKWLTACGVTVATKENGDADCTIEIAPHFAHNLATLKSKTLKFTNIAAGEFVYLG